MPLAIPTNSARFQRAEMSGTPSSTASRARRTSPSRRYSFHDANTDGVGRLRKRSPSILSHGSVLIDRPR